MKTSCLVLTLAISAAAFSPALAAQSARTPKTTADAAASTTVGEAGSPIASPQARRICRGQGVTGTRVPGPRMCMTKDEWRRLDRGESVTILREKGASRR